MHVFILFFFFEKGGGGVFFGWMEGMKSVGKEMKDDEIKSFIHS